MMDSIITKRLKKVIVVMHNYINEFGEIVDSFITKKLSSPNPNTYDIGSKSMYDTIFDDLDYVFDKIMLYEHYLDSDSMNIIRELDLILLAIDISLSELYTQCSTFNGIHLLESLHERLINFTSVISNTGINPTGTIWYEQPKARDYVLDEIRDKSWLHNPTNISEPWYWFYNKNNKLWYVSNEPSFVHKLVTNHVPIFSGRHFIYYDDETSNTYVSSNSLDLTNGIYWINGIMFSNRDDLYGIWYYEDKDTHITYVCNNKDFRFSEYKDMKTGTNLHIKNTFCFDDKLGGYMLSITKDNRAYVSRIPYNTSSAHEIPMMEKYSLDIIKSLYFSHCENYSKIA